METLSLADLVRMLKADAVDLRKVGVLSLKYGAVEVTFAVAADELPADFGKRDEEDEAAAPKNTFNDPATYGLPPDAEVPGFSRPGSLTDEQDMERGRDR